MSLLDSILRFFRLRPKEVEEPVPQKEAPPPVPVTKWITPDPSTTILIVDDSKTVQMVLTKQLTRQGYQCISAFDGGSAVEIARKIKPALILMDVVMPVQNGFQATRDIRRDSDPLVANVPVIIMSSNAQPSEELWSIKIKANAFMAKPFSDEVLFTNMERLLFPQLTE